MLDLLQRLERWIKLWAARGYPLPVTDGIDLNSNESRALVRYHASGEPAGATDQLFADEHELEAAFGEWDKAAS